MVESRVSLFPSHVLPRSGGAKLSHEYEHQYVTPQLKGSITYEKALHLPMKKPRIGLGIVGMGFMGLTHLSAAERLRGGRVVAMVTSDPRKARGDFRQVRGNFGGGGGHIDVSRLHVHPTLDALLEDDTVDLVDLCLPSYLHASAATRVLKGGKHVLVEKPIALTTTDANRMMTTATKTGRLLMVGQVLKYFPEFAALEKAIRSAQWGKLLALHLRRSIAKPDWGADSWFSDSRKSGGMVVDLHIHDTDFVVYLFGQPKAVTSHGLVRQGSVDVVRTTYHYKKRSAPLVTAEAGWINAPSLIFEHGYDAFFEKATLHFNSSHTPRPLLYQANKARELKLSARDGFQNELQEAVMGVREKTVPKGLAPKNAAISLAVCHAEVKSARSGKTVVL